MRRRAFFKIVEDEFPSIQEAFYSYESDRDCDFRPFPNHLVWDLKIKWGEERRYQELAYFFEMKGVMTRSSYFGTEGYGFDHINLVSTDLFCAAIYYIVAGQKKYAEQMMRAHFLLAEQEFLRTQESAIHFREWNAFLWKEYKGLFCSFLDLEQALAGLEQMKEQGDRFKDEHAHEEYQEAWTYHHRLITFTLRNITDKYIYLSTGLEERIQLKSNVARYFHDLMHGTGDVTLLGGNEAET